MNLFFLFGACPYDFEAGQRLYAGHWKGWAMKVETFLGPETARLKRELLGTKKVDYYIINSFFHIGYD